MRTLDSLRSLVFLAGQNGERIDAIRTTLRTSSSARPSSIASITSTTPPVVKITSPGNGATVTGTVTLSANATDAVGVASMMLYVDGAVVATTNLGSISYKWNARKAAKGSHTLTVTAKDTAGNQATVSIQVSK